MTDGRPNVGSVDDGIAAIKDKKWGNIICLGAGEGADGSVIDLLKRIAAVHTNKNGADSELPRVLQLKDIGPSGLKAFFQWVSQSIKKTSKKLNNATADGGSSSDSDLPPLPPEITQV